MKVKSALLFHRDVRATKTDVNVKDGIVSLSGEASSEAQKELTTEYAKDVENVKEVKNDMTVAKTPAQPSETIGEKIRAVRADVDHRRGRRKCQLPGRLHRTDARREPASRRRGRVGRVGRCRDQIFHRAELVPGDELGRGGIYNFVTKRGLCKGRNSKISWTQVETGSAITWKYPGCVLLGDNFVGEFYSIAVTNHYQQADTGTKMLHLGRNTRSTIISKGIAAGHGQNSYRGLVQVRKSATHARNFSQCDSLLIGNQCGAHTFPYIEVKNSSSQVEHEASTSKIGDDQIFYCNQRGISTQDAINMIVNGFCKDVFQKLPMEFAVEAQKLLGVSLEGSVG